MPQTPSDNSFAGAMRRARAAINLMSDLHISPTPARFTVAFAHHLGEVGALSLEMNRLIGHDRLTGAAIDALYQQFFAPECESADIRVAGREMHDLVTDIGDQIAAVRLRSEEFGAHLREFTQALEKSAGDSLRRRAAAILGETDAVAREQRDLQYRLSFTLREIETLRGQLDRAEREARQDPLTGIGNRAQFDGTLQGALLRAGREDQPLSLLMLDMDHFKRFNERHGPAIGDQVLKLVAHLLTQTARENGGEAARFGGEAFALLLRGCALPRASQIADRLRLQVAGKTVRNRRTGEIFGQVTLSIGVAFYRPGESAAQLVNRADEAVYLAKAEGRNRVVTDDHPGLAP